MGWLGLRERGEVTLALRRWLRRVRRLRRWVPAAGPPGAAEAVGCARSGSRVLGVGSRRGSCPGFSGGSPASAGSASGRPVALFDSSGMAAATGLDAPSSSRSGGPSERRETAVTIARQLTMSPKSTSPTAAPIKLRVRRTFASSRARSSKDAPTSRWKPVESAGLGPTRSPVGTAFPPSRLSVSSGAALDAALSRSMICWARLPRSITTASQPNATSWLRTR